MNVKLKRHCTFGETVLQTFNTAFFQYTDELKQFKIVLNDRFQDLLREEETTMEVKTIVNRYQSQNLQYARQNSSTVWR
ncbi:unnamed protein product [Schistosoma margrebowiei]|uniref:Uncharacterized protein n=1 Tax=Schistosoma margrebowiei TaxID=48269 RepID=A0A183N5K6_9TREM|nr:unnamed protein product [Schistosoma margrebowiei]